ncbi:hypothetical protein [Nocardioides sp. zg-1230]|uniref:hypothetical protein n=1 Tax=Nocardioides sp. zg-1230 TaxID=2736601 RepID=UPI001553CFAC|nr:hypothetical protein [Nocardioides sp. zg-1230]NPC41652.1 hypothetical protein [Nocardioides sp. zg-1230]
MVDIRFYQAAVVVIPILVVAAAFMSRDLDPEGRQSGREPRWLGGLGITGAIVAACLVLVAELLALGSLAAGETAAWTFVVVLTAITLLSAGLAVMAVHQLVEPLRGTWLQGIEWLVIVTTAVFAAAAISLAFLET